MHRNQNPVLKVGLGLLLALVGLCWADNSANGQLLPENFPGQIVHLEPADLLTDSAADTQTEKELTKEPTPKEQTRYRVAPGDNLRKIAERYQVEWTALAKANALADQDFIRVGQVLIIPQAGSPASATATAAKPDPLYMAGNRLDNQALRRTAWRLSSWLRHCRPHGTPIVAVDSGQVYLGGLEVYLRTLRNHWPWTGTVNRFMDTSSKLLVQKGTTVTAGQTIAKIGSTGRSTGPHLHLEIYDNGKTVNPLAFLE